jgi:hypothetical protein
MPLRVGDIRQVLLGGETLGLLDKILELLSSELPLDHLATPSVSLITLIYQCLLHLVTRCMSGRSPAKEMIIETLGAV